MKLKSKMAAILVFLCISGAVFAEENSELNPGRTPEQATNDKLFKNGLQGGMMFGLCSINTSISDAESVGPLGNLKFTDSSLLELIGYRYKNFLIGLKYLGGTSKAKSQSDTYKRGLSSALLSLDYRVLQGYYDNYPYIVRLGLGSGSSTVSASSENKKYEISGNGSITALSISLDSLMGAHWGISTSAHYINGQASNFEGTNATVTEEIDVSFRGYSLVLGVIYSSPGRDFPENDVFSKC